MSSCNAFESGLCKWTLSEATTYDMIVHDAEYLDFAAKYHAVGKEMENILEDYLKTVRGVSDLCEGEFSDSMKVFSDVVEQILKDGAGETLRGLNNAMSVYIGALDDADGNWN